LIRSSYLFFILRSTSYSEDKWDILGSDDIDWDFDRAIETIDCSDLCTIDTDTEFAILEVLDTTSTEECRSNHELTDGLI
jgi:hypothetical protein